MIELFKSLIDWLSWLLSSRKKKRKKSVTIESKGLRITRGIVFAILLIFPISIWLDSIFDDIKKLPPARLNSSCPPVDPIPIAEATQHPERFQHRLIWMIGKLYQGKRKCIKTHCFLNTGTCCHPCYADLYLVSEYGKIKIDGHLSGKRLNCIGTTCSFKCSPLSSGRYYALSGYLKLSFHRDPKTKQFISSARLFYILDACLLQSPPPPDRLMRIPDPPSIQKRLRLLPNITP